MAAIKKPDKNSSTVPIYYVSFEDYLKPKTAKKQNSLLLFNKSSQKPNLRLKLLEHPVLIAQHRSKWCLIKEKVLAPKFKKYLKPLDICRNSLKRAIGNIQLPRFLTFLNARNDDTACKRKSGFEIYCELASIHGFNNFVGATTWQRAFWFLVVLIAVIMSGFVLLLSHFMNVNTPTILYSESTQYPTWSIPFPAVTICNLNRISKIKARNLVRKFQKTTNMTFSELSSLLPLALYTTENLRAGVADYKKLHDVFKMNNYTMLKLLKDISPNCEKELVRCTFHGEFTECGQLFKKTQTSFGQCCSFNYKALQKISNKLTRTDVTASDHELYASNCGYTSGLTVLLDPQLKDYKASSTLTPGYRILIHDAYSFPDFATMQRIVAPATSNKIRVWSQQTYATDHISALSIQTRKCYLSNERQLYQFASYSQINCLAECRSLMMYEKCQCALPFMPKMQNWTVCGLEDVQCYLKYKSILVSDLKYSKSDLSDEQFICDCYPLCDFHMYNIAMDSEGLTRKYSITEKLLYEGVNITNHILLRIFVSELHGERLRLDVYENWLSFLGTFGGITGLYMGYSFLSGFELIFFVFVRPACNWLTKQQIKYRLKKRQQKLQQEEAHKKQSEAH